MEDLVPENSKSKTKATHSLTSFLEICFEYVSSGKQKQKQKTNGRLKLKTLAQQKNYRQIKRQSTGRGYLQIIYLIRG